MDATDAGAQSTDPPSAETPSSAAPATTARDFDTALDAELDAVRRRRKARGDGDRQLHGQSAVDRAHDAELVALAFSGGGIRSATFNLGIATALARLGLLRRFDYLSTNSGGGYMGGWLLSWIHRAGLGTVERQLAGERDGTGAAQAPGTAASSDPAAGADPVTWLRRFSNYLTPKVGAFSADTWTMVATYLRNLLLNQTILILALAAILLSPRLVVLLSRHLYGLHWHGLPFAMLSLGVAIVFIGLNLSTIAVEGAAPETEPRRKSPWFAATGWVQVLVVLPLLVTSWIAGLWVWSITQQDAYAGQEHWRLVDFLAARGVSPAVWFQGLGPAAEPLAWAAATAALYLLAWIAAVIIGLLRRRTLRAARHVSGRRLVFILLLSAIPAGALGGLVLWGLSLVCHSAGDLLGRLVPWHLFHVNVWLPPALVVVFLLTGFLHVGLTGRLFSEGYREWWSRLGAWLLIYTVTWLGLFGVALYAPIAVLWLESLAAAAGLGWIGTTVAGVLVGKRSAAAEEGAEAKPGLVRRVLVAVAPQVFIIGLLALIAFGLHLGLPMRGSVDATCYSGWPPDDVSLARITTCESERMWAATRPLDTSALLALLVLGAAFLSWRVDINQFSMHLFYRNRLIRAYLGASNRQRRAQPFTAFDPADDLPLARLVPARGDFDSPYPLLNTTLNLVSGQELAWQERKGASFVFTPLHSGFEVEGRAESDTPRWLVPRGYRPTAGYEQTEEGLTLGTAMGISGAAVSPNQGAQSTAALAFLLTVFNVRLGWWLGNPRDERTWRRIGPLFGLASLLSELFGMTDERSRFVYLSDGGHFDNLGLYELVRRRCRCIVSTDAGADPKAHFGSLGAVIRKCRTDFGIEIEIDVEKLRHPEDDMRSKAHCAVGRIRYDRVDPGAEPGILLYVKASLTGDEPEDVQNYATENPPFPHESTADQWFGEAQFESYRRLGDHVATKIFEPLGDDPAALDSRELFRRLQGAWGRPPGATASS